MFGPKREGNEGGWRRLHNEELHNLYPSTNVIRVTNARRMKWAEHVTRVGEMRNAYNTLVGNLKRRDHSEDLGVDGRIVL
jgi:hypothetical protein